MCGANKRGCWIRPYPAAPRHAQVLSSCTVVGSFSAYPKLLSVDARVASCYLARLIGVYSMCAFVYVSMFCQRVKEIYDILISSACLLDTATAVVAHSV